MNIEDTTSNLRLHLGVIFDRCCFAAIYRRRSVVLFTKA